MVYSESNTPRRDNRVRFELMEHIGVLNKKDNGWTREVNIVAWNDNPPKVDIREWNQGHERMSRGVTLFEEEAEKLTKMLARRYGLNVQPAQQIHAAQPVQHFQEPESEPQPQPQAQSYPAAGTQSYNSSAPDVMPFAAPVMAAGVAEAPEENEEDSADTVAADDVDQIAF